MTPSALVSLHAWNRASLLCKFAASAILLGVWPAGAGQTTGPTVEGAIRSGNVGLLRHLLSRASVNEPLASSGLTPLGYAVSREAVSSAGELLALGADPNKSVRSGGGTTPILLAVRRNSGSGIVRMLVSHGAYVNGGSSDSDTLLEAVMRPSAGMVEVLLAAGANVNWRSRRYGVAPIHMAALLGYTKICQILLAHGARIAVETRDGQSALNAAAQGLSKGAVECLLRAGADPNHAGKDGNTPLIDAARESYSNPSSAAAILSMLMHHGADAHLRDKKGRSAADYVGHRSELRRALYRADRSGGRQ